MSNKKKSSFQIPAMGKAPLPTQIHASERSINSQFKIPAMKKVTELAERLDVDEVQPAPLDSGCRQQAPSLDTKTIRDRQRAFAVSSTKTVIPLANGDPFLNAEMDSKDEHCLE
jgi:hypothetical protein